MTGRPADVVEAARAFRSTLDPLQRSRLVQRYSFENAARWHTYPQWSLGNRRRLGVDLSTLTSIQWDAMVELLAAALGDGPGAGVAEVLEHIETDEYLGDSGMGPGYGRAGFRIAYLGEPSPTGRWQLQFGGHHLAVTNTYEGGLLVGATPSFRAIEPAGPFRWDGRTLDPMRRKRGAVEALLGSLADGQVRRATLPGRDDDLTLRPGRDWAFPDAPRGIPGAELDPAQRELLAAVVAAWVEDLPAADASRILSGYLADFDRTHLALTGDRALRAIGDGLRIDGPAVWIEYRMDEPYSTDLPHPHSVWRDRRTDYGGLRP